MNKKQFLLQLQAVNLIAVDLHLFLDTHPDNKEALNDYEKVSKQYQSLKQQYEHCAVCAGAPASCRNCAPSPGRPSRRRR